MSTLYYTIAIIFTIIYLPIFGLIYLITVLFDKKRSIVHRASRFWCLSIYRICPRWRIIVTGKENVEKDKCYVITSNHQSMWDIMLLYIVPTEFKWVAKKEVLDMPIVGWVMRMHGDITIERGRASAIRKLLREGKKVIDNEVSIMVFPEGTRTHNGRVGQFKEGAFMMAKHAGVAILPCVIEGTGTMMDGKKVRIPHNFRVAILPEIPKEMVKSMSVEELAAEDRRRITEYHKTLCPDLYSNQTNPQSTATK